MSGSFVRDRFLPASRRWTLLLSVGTRQCGLRLFLVLLILLSQQMTGFGSIPFLFKVQFYKNSKGDENNLILFRSLLLRAKQAHRKKSNDVL